MSHGKWKELPGGSRVRDVDERELPKKLRKRIKRSMDDGVSYSVDFSRRRDPAERMRITSIHWRPGKRNALAAAVIKEVHGPVPLHLDGHWYTITPSEAPSDQG